MTIRLLARLATAARTAANLASQSGLIWSMETQLKWHIGKAAWMRTRRYNLGTIRTEALLSAFMSWMLRKISV